MGRELAHKKGSHLPGQGALPSTCHSTPPRTQRYHPGYHQTLPPSTPTKTLRYHPFNLNPKSSFEASVNFWQQIPTKWLQERAHPAWVHPQEDRGVSVPKKTWLTTHRGRHVRFVRLNIGVESSTKHHRMSRTSPQSGNTFHSS